MGGRKSSRLVTGDVGCGFSKVKEALGGHPGTLSVSLRIPTPFHALFLRKLWGGESSPWRRVLMALISAWFRSSSATLALASDKLSSSFRTWASAFICSGRTNPVGKWGGPGQARLASQLRCPSAASQATYLILLEHPCLRNLQRLTIFYQRKPRAFGLAHSPSLPGPC